MEREEKLAQEILEQITTKVLVGTNYGEDLYRTELDLTKLAMFLAKNTPHT